MSNNPNSNSTPNLQNLPNQPPPRYIQIENSCGSIPINFKNLIENNSKYFQGGGGEEGDSDFQLSPTSITYLSNQTNEKDLKIFFNSKNLIENEIFEINNLIILKFIKYFNSEGFGLMVDHEMVDVILQEVEEEVGEVLNKNVKTPSDSKPKVKLAIQIINGGLLGTLGFRDNFDKFLSLDFKQVFPDGLCVFLVVL